MDEQLITAIENNIIGYRVLYGEGSHEDFYLADGWTTVQIESFAASVDGLVLFIVNIETIND